MAILDGYLVQPPIVNAGTDTPIFLLDEEETHGRRRPREPHGAMAKTLGDVVLHRPLLLFGEGIEMAAGWYRARLEVNGEIVRTVRWEFHRRLLAEHGTEMVSAIAGLQSSLQIRPH